MSLQNIEGIAIAAASGFALFIGYNIYNDIKRSFRVPDSETKSWGEPCFGNEDCSVTGTAGGPSVGIDILGAKPFGCCGGKCTKKTHDVILGNYFCPEKDNIAVELKGGLNDSCKGDGDCSKTGFVGREPVSIFDNPLNIGCCNGQCKKKKDGSCSGTEETQTVVDKEYPTVALGAKCNKTSDCGYNGVYGSGPSDGTYSVCENNICEKNKKYKKTMPLGGSCYQTSDCSSIEVSGGAPSDGTNIVCYEGKCSRKKEIVKTPI